MDRNLQVGFRKVDGGHPVALTNREKDRLDGLHAEVRHIHVEIGGREIDDGSPRPRGLPHNEKTAVKAWGRKRSKLHRTLGHQGLSSLPQSHPLGGQRVIRRHGDGSLGQRRSGEERNAVTKPQHLRHPRLRTSALPGLPMEGQTAAEQGQAG